MTHRTKKASRRTTILLTSAVVGLAFAVTASANAESAKDFYKGKDVRFIIPSGVGGGYDAYGRLLARHLGDNIPGNPHLVVENMPGASGVRGTNWMYNLAPKDGTVMGETYNTLLTEPLLGDTATQFDPTKFEWVGSITTQYNSCMVWSASPIKTIQDAMKHEVKVSTTGLSGNSARTPYMLNKVLGTKFHLISGYTTTGMRLAVERGEVEGICGFSYDTYEAANPEWIKGHKIRFILQTGTVPNKHLPNVPLLKDLVKNPKDLQALKVLDVNEQAGRPFLFPPGVPQYLVKAVRTAFDETMKDPKFLKDAHTMHIEPDPMTGQQVEAALKESYAMPKDVVARAAELWPPATALKKSKNKKPKS